MWYYVYKGERQGPVPFDTVKGLFVTGEIKESDMVWTKGFESWKKIVEVNELMNAKSDHVTAAPEELGDSLLSHAGDDDVVFIKIGSDRGQKMDTEYGPYNIKVIKNLYEQQRINVKTLIFFRGMSNWTMLGDFIDFKEVFNIMPPLIESSERRVGVRRPFVARLFIESNQQVYEGVCRDISTGGMQILISNPPVKIGSKISINVHPENTSYHFVAEGEVVRLLDGTNGFSFRFTNLNSDALKSINRYLEN